MRPRLLVYRQFLLPYSETFVKWQTESFRELEPVMVGLERVQGRSLDVAVPNEVLADRSFAIDRADGALFKLTGWSPGMSSLVRRSRPDIILAHFAQDGLRISRLARRLDVPLCVFVHGSDILRTPSRSLSSPSSHRQLSRRWDELLGSVIRFFAVSEHLRQVLIRRGAAPDQVEVRRVGVPLGPEPDWAQDDGSILFVGRLVENKGVHLLLRAVALFDRNQAVHVVGGGPEERRLRALASALGLTNVMFHGAKAQSDVFRLMSKCALLCAPSIQVSSGVSEGFGQVVLEAQERGRPAVVFDTGGLPETVERGETGLVVPSSDVLGLSEALNDLLGDGDRRRRMGCRARARIVSEFNILDQTMVLERGLITLLKGRG